MVDVALALIALEAIVLYAWTRRGRGGVVFADLAFNLVSGGALLLGLRGALHGAPATFWLGCLSVSLFAHLADFYRRLRPTFRR